MKTAQIRTVAAAGALMAAMAGVGTSPAMAQDPWALSANIGAVSNYIWRGVTQTGDQAAIQGGVDVAHESGFYAGTWASNIDWDEGSSEPVATEVIGIVPTRPNGQPLRDADGNLVVIGEGFGETAGADSASPNYELDLYLGYDFAVNDDFSIGLSGIYYAYPDGRDSDFGEIGISGSYKWFTLGAAYTVYGENDEGLFDDGDWYFFGGAEVALPYDFGFSARAGYYDFRYDDGDVLAVAPNGVVYTKTESYDYWHFGASLSREAGDFGTFSLNWDQNNGDQDLGYDTDPKFWVGWNKEF